MRTIGRTRATHASANLIAKIIPSDQLLIEKNLIKKYIEKKTSKKIFREKNRQKKYRKKNVEKIIGKYKQNQHLRK